MNFEDMTYKEIRNKDIEYIENVLQKIKNKLEYDEWFGGWCIGEESLIDYFYNEETTYLNPKELEGEMENIIENKLKVKK